MNEWVREWWNSRPAARVWAHHFLGRFVSPGFLPLQSRVRLLLFLFFFPDSYHLSVLFPCFPAANSSLFSPAVISSCFLYSRHSYSILLWTQFSQLTSSEPFCPLLLHSLACLFSFISSLLWFSKTNFLQIPAHFHSFPHPPSLLKATYFISDFVCSTGALEEASGKRQSPRRLPTYTPSPPWPGSGTAHDSVR